MGERFFSETTFSEKATDYTLKDFKNLGKSHTLADLGFMMHTKWLIKKSFKYLLKRNENNETVFMYRGLHFLFFVLL